MVSLEKIQVIRELENLLVEEVVDGKWLMSGDDIIGTAARIQDGDGRRRRRKRVPEIVKMGIA